MEKIKLRSPHFGCNVKSYVWGKKLHELADKADELAAKYDVDTLFTAQLIDLSYVIENCPHLIPQAQIIDSLEPGRGMGYVLPEALAEAGVKVAFINHAENPKTLHEVYDCIRRCDEVGILSMVATDTIEEARAVAEFHPDIMVCELTSLIGTGTVADESYMRESLAAVKEISPETLVHQGAGIHSGQNVYDTLMLGADATGGTSGIVCADDPFAVLEDMISAVARARKDLGK